MEYPLTHVPMLVHYRHRRSMYYPTNEQKSSTLKRIVWAVILLLVLYYLGKGFLRIIGWGGSIERLPTVLHVESRGNVNVTLEGQDAKRAENDMKLFPGEKVSTDASANASLVFFDGTTTRLAQNTALTIAESSRSKTDGTVALELASGMLWISVPDAATSSGSTERTVTTPVLNFALPARTEALLSPTSLTVFHANGVGAKVSAKGHDDIFVGEGQRIDLPAGTTLNDLKKDLYAYRASFVSGSGIDMSFVEQSREITPSIASETKPAATSSGDLLTVTAPSEGAAVTGNVSVTGRYAPTVSSVTINGHAAILDAGSHTFSQQVSVPDGLKQFDILIQALDAKANVLGEVHRLVKKSSDAAATSSAPTITSPAKTGETYQTSAEELVLRGTAPSNAAAIFVNDYKLQLFDPAKGTWSYLASLKLGNMVVGTNTYDVYAEDDGGVKSVASRITIINGPGKEGVIQTASGAAKSSVASAPKTLPTNAPLTPGILRVSGLAAQPQFIATGTGFLLEGITSSSTASVWVNGYQLKLYKPGKTFWNYLASPDLKTIKPGKNVFKIVARNVKDEILDELDYTVEYTK